LPKQILGIKEKVVARQLMRENYETLGLNIRAPNPLLYLSN